MSGSLDSMAISRDAVGDADDVPGGRRANRHVTDGDRASEPAGEDAERVRRRIVVVSAGDREAEVLVERQEVEVLDADTGDDSGKVAERPPTGHPVAPPTVVLDQRVSLPTAGTHR